MHLLMVKTEVIKYINLGQPVVTVMLAHAQ